MSDEDYRVFYAGFMAGFQASREGFNGECPYEHLAPEPSRVVDEAREMDTELIECLSPLAEVMYRAFKAVR